MTSGETVGWRPMVACWADLGIKILEKLRTLPSEQRYRGKLVHSLIQDGIFTPEEVKGDKAAVVAITEKLGIMERQGLCKKTGQFAQGNQLWAAVEEIPVDIDLASRMAVHLTLMGHGDNLWLSTGVLEERGHKYLMVKTTMSLPRATTGGVAGKEVVTIKVKYDPRWPHEGLKFSYDVPFRSEVRKLWRAGLERTIKLQMSRFKPSPCPFVAETALSIEPTMDIQAALEELNSHG